MSTEERTGRRIRRILVAVDTSSHGQAALEAAVHLASALGAELMVLYVENADLLNVPRLSFIREADALSGDLREFERNGVERKIRLEAARVRRSLERAVLKRDVKWSFRVSRGRVAVELLEAAAEADLVSLGARSHSLGRSPGSTARAVLAQSGKPVMILRRGARLGDKVCVLFDGTAQAREGLLLAERIVEREGWELCLLLRSPQEAPEELWEEASSAAGGLDSRVRAISLGTLDPREVSAQVRRNGCGLLVVPRDRFTLSEGILTSLVDTAPCPVVLVGEG